MHFSDNYKLQLPDQSFSKFQPQMKKSQPTHNYYMHQSDIELVNSDAKIAQKSMVFSVIAEKEL